MRRVLNYFLFLSLSLVVLLFASRGPSTNLHRQSVRCACKTVAPSSQPSQGNVHLRIPPNSSPQLGPSDPNKARHEDAWSSKTAIYSYDKVYNSIISSNEYTMISYSNSQRRCHIRQVSDTFFHVVTYYRANIRKSVAYFLLPSCISHSLFLMFRKLQE